MFFCLTPEGKFWKSIKVNLENLRAGGLAKQTKSSSMYLLLSIYFSYIFATFYETKVTASSASSASFSFILVFFSYYFWSKKYFHKSFYYFVILKGIHAVLNVRYHSLYQSFCKLLAQTSHLTIQQDKQDNPLTTLWHIGICTMICSKVICKKFWYLSKFFRYFPRHWCPSCHQR